MSVPVPFARALPPLPAVKDIVKLYKLRAKKQLSQNFLLDMNINRKIVKCAGKMQGGHVCEVGPGPGGITRALLAAGAKQVVLIEKDQRFLPGLDLLNEASDGRLRIFHGDVLRFDMSDVFPRELAQPWTGKSPNVHIVGNLPFSVSTPLLIQYLEHISRRSGAWALGRVRLTLTFQKEVADRLVAPMLHQQRSRLSVMAQHLCDVELKYIIPGKAFVPEPDVNVGLVHFVPKCTPEIEQPFKLVEKVVRHVFHYRQKMIKRGVMTLFPPDRPEFTKFMFESSCVPPYSRSFMLSIEEIGRLCEAYRAICDHNPGVFEYDYRSQENAKQWRKNSNIISPEL